MENSINQDATTDNNACVNNNMPIDTPISNDAANPNSRSANDSQSQCSSNLRGKIDLAWKYVALQMVNGKPQYQCLFCLQVFNGGGIHMMKKHLAKITGDVKKCPKVPYDVENRWKVIEWIGPNDIVHVVTNNAANYVAAGRLINRKYDNIYWSPCAAHCLNLILNDISSMAHISNLATRASKITVFVYNHTVFLSWLGQRPHWREIVRPGATDFATVFITLKRIFDRKKELQALVVDSIFTDHKLKRNAIGRAMSAIILDCKFWDDCFIVCKLVGPLIHLLRIVDADDKLSLGYVYEGMLRAEDAIKEMFRQSKTAYQPYIDIINSRWDKHLKKDIHACNKLDSVQAMKEIHLYRDRKKSFDRQEAIRAASELKPDEWWRLFGGSAPCLQKRVVRILSQPSASSGCERNWSLFDQIHTKRRNRLEHDRLNDIVYVTYNLRLKSR
nr:uncharacterized protein LOC112748584 [Arachis hypogaea]